MKIWSRVLKSYWLSHIRNNSLFKESKEIQREWNSSIIISDSNRVKDVQDMSPQQITLKIKNTPGLENWIRSNRPDLEFLLKPPRSAAYLKRKYKLENFPRYKTK